MRRHQRARAEEKRRAERPLQRRNGELAYGNPQQPRAPLLCQRRRRRASRLHSHTHAPAALVPSSRVAATPQEQTYNVPKEVDELVHGLAEGSGPVGQNGLGLRHHPAHHEEWVPIEHIDGRLQRSRACGVLQGKWGLEKVTGVSQRAMTRCHNRVCVCWEGIAERPIGSQTAHARSVSLYLYQDHPVSTPPCTIAPLCLQGRMGTRKHGNLRPYRPLRRPAQPAEKESLSVRTLDPPNGHSH